MMRHLNLILLAVASVFLFWMLKQLGWKNLAECFLQIGYYWPLLLVPYGLVSCLIAFSWTLLLPTSKTRPSMGRLFCLRLAGESLNQLTPTASMGGEPFKALRLKAMGVPWEEATASVVIQKGIGVLSLVLYTFLGLGLTACILDFSYSYMGALCLAATVLGGLSLVFVLVQSRHPCATGIRILEKCRICPASLKARKPQLENLDKCLAGFYRQYPSRAFWAFILFFSSWLVHGTEVYLVFRLMGHPINWAPALCLDTLAVLFAALGFMIPASVGVQDAGTILASLGFNLGAALGGAFTLMRRVREAFWLGLGLVVVAREK